MEEKQVKIAPTDGNVGVKTDTLVLDYYYDDPSEDLLHGPLVIPPFPKGMPDFTVVGWKDIPDVAAGTPAYQAAQVYGAVATTLAYVMNLVPPYFKDWSSTSNLVAIPRAGNQLNAYYDRSSLRFFWGKDPKTNKIVYTCDAVGIVAHELGHAILDAIRPDLWNTAILEFFAFHEAFGDILALASVLQHDAVIEQMLKETSIGSEGIPNLWQTNVVSRLARQLGHAIYYSSSMVIGAEKYLRNAFNEFKYIDPTTLAYGTGDDVLTQEPHNFSRIFSGAWYQCFCELFKADYTSHDPAAALIAVKNARDTMIRALLDAVMVATSTLRFLPTVATTMVHVLEKQNKMKEAEIVKSVMKSRNLFNEDVLTLSPVSTASVDATVPPHQMKAQIGATVGRPPQIVRVDLPKWVGLRSGENVHDVLSKSVNNFISYVLEKGLVGDENDNNMFAVTSGGVLVRNFICSSFRGMPQMSTTPNIMG